MPGPYTLAGRIEHPDRYAVTEMLIPIVARELEALVAAGCERITLDEPSMSCYAWREDPDRLVDIFNRTVAGVKGRCYLGTHLCFGNFKGRAVGRRRYAPMFPAFLGMDADELHLEMASREFAELEVIEQVVAAGKDVGVGVIDVKSYYVESPEDVEERVRACLQHVRRAAQRVARLRAVADGALGGAPQAGEPGRGRAAARDSNDIETRAECERLVRTFYGRALNDPIIGFIFVDVAKLDLEAHVPRITSFWETILLGARSYGGARSARTREIHVQVPLRRAHFEQWLNLWQSTRPTSSSRAERAELAKAHAVRVAAAFHPASCRASGRPAPLGQTTSESRWHGAPVRGRHGEPGRGRSGRRNATPAGTDVDARGCRRAGRRTASRSVRSASGPPCRRRADRDRERRRHVEPDDRQGRDPDAEEHGREDRPARKPLARLTA